MTAGPDDRRGGGFESSVRGSRLRRPNRTGWLLLGIVVATVALDGARGLFAAFPRGDLLYHWGLTHDILRGELLPGGPYEGLPAYYPPGFHAALASIAGLLSTTVETATAILGWLWLPVLPLTTFALARRLSGRDDVGLVATVLTTFGGAFVFSADRLWVNSLFLVGQQAWPIFPRDLVFGLLPLAVLAFLNALGSRRWWAWSLVSGGLLGACALIQVQLLLPIPLALLVVAVGAAVLDRSRARRAVLSLALTGLVAAILFAPWFLATLAEIRRNGGVALDSADTLLPVRIGFWDFPREFGVFLPLALIGIGFVLLHLRERDPSSTGLAPRRPEDPLVLVAWFVVPWLLAVAYDPGWPLEDALRPQRLWLIASQPAAILAAIGLVGAARQIVGIVWRRPAWVTPAIVGVLLVAALPTMAFTLRLLFTSWTTPGYAHLDLAADRVPDMAAVLGDTGPRSTVLTYEDWSSLAWYETGSWVVGVKPPGYAKPAFDPEVFTGRSQEMRRQDLARAFRGDPAALAAVADEYGADRILVARKGDSWGLLHQVAAVAAAQPGGVTGSTSVREGNGTDSVELQPGARLIIAPAVADRPIDLEIRFAGGSEAQPAPARRARLVGVGSGGDRPLGDLVVPATSTDAWQVIPATVTLEPGERLAIEAVDPLAIQSLLGFVPPEVPAGWHVATTTDDAVVLERDR